MSWWSRNKKLMMLLAVITFLAVAVTISFSVFRPSGFSQICTLVGCVGSIKVELLGLPASSSYQISVTHPSGEIQSLSCGPNVAEEPIVFGHGCTSDGAFFSLDQDSSAPEEIKVIVTVNGAQVLQSFRPAYEKYQPNGKDCLPICYSATVQINISQ